VVFDANYVLSRSRNDTEDINFNATQGNRFDLEYADAVNDRRHKAAVRTTYTGVRNLTLATVLDFQTGTPINRAAGFDANGPIDLDGSGDTYGNGFLGNQDRFFGVPRNGERLPSAFRADLSAAYRVPTVRGGVELRADVFNVLNAVNESGFANGIGGGGSRTQVGRPGDPLVFGRWRRRGRSSCRCGTRCDAGGAPRRARGGRPGGRGGAGRRRRVRPR
jgi:hypothetical protein